MLLTKKKDSSGRDSGSWFDKKKWVKPSKTGCLCECAGVWNRVSSTRRRRRPRRKHAGNETQPSNWSTECREGERERERERVKVFCLPSAACFLSDSRSSFFLSFLLLLVLVFVLVLVLLLLRRHRVSLSLSLPLPFFLSLSVGHTWMHLQHRTYSPSSQPPPTSFFSTYFIFNSFIFRSSFFPLVSNRGGRTESHWIRLIQVFDEMAMFTNIFQLYLVLYWWNAIFEAFLFCFLYHRLLFSSAFSVVPSPPHSSIFTMRPKNRTRKGSQQRK